ncbi:hypothetical protein IHQ71_18680 [Rhizobium sp. TH2]|uniref:hypothetical protein n=1 Tax=Rhizobium sp. TH2 TaxID=2775403 RepID=UPI0021572C3C|nr:hypothetical protein [Rhizobium sp. TH2]UVC07233.1 hypothetical protein IHQ71_18680 [Rhizobium sp. TH2]
MNEVRKTNSFWKTIKITFASAIIAGALWVGWDHAQALLWKGGPARNGYEFWFTPYVVYIMLQTPAAIGALVARMLIGHRIPSMAGFLVYPIISTAVMLATGYFGGVNFNYPIVIFLVIAIPKTAIYGLVFALLDHVSRTKLALQAAA